jgi:alcohol dehydrogenase, propanol-preferring
LIKDEWKDFGIAMKPETKGIAGHEGAGVVVAGGPARF